MQICEWFYFIGDCASVVPITFSLLENISDICLLYALFEKKSKKDHFLLMELLRRKRIHGECMGLFLVFDLTSIAFKVACLIMQISDNIHKFRNG